MPTPRAYRYENMVNRQATDAPGYKFQYRGRDFLNRVNCPVSIRHAIIDDTLIIPLRSLVQIIRAYKENGHDYPLERYSMHESELVDFLRPIEQYKNAEITLERVQLRPRTLCMQTVVNSKKFFNLTNGGADLENLDKPGQPCMIRYSPAGPILAAFYLPPIINYFDRSSFEPALQNLEKFAQADRRVILSNGEEGIFDVAKKWSERKQMKASNLHYVVEGAEQDRIDGIGLELLRDPSMFAETPPSQSEKAKEFMERARRAFGMIESLYTGMKRPSKAEESKVFDALMKTLPREHAGTVIKAFIDIEQETEGNAHLEAFLERLLNMAVKRTRSLRYMTPPIDEAFHSQQIAFALYNELKWAAAKRVTQNTEAPKQKPSMWRDVAKDKDRFTISVDPRRLLREAREELDGKKTIPVIKDGHHRAISAFLTGWPELRFIAIRNSTEIPSGVPVRLMNLRMVDYDPAEREFKYLGAYEKGIADLTKIGADP